MVDYDEISYSEIEDCIMDAKEGHLSAYWQGYAEREFDALRAANGKLPERARRLYREYKQVLKNVPQMESGEEKDVDTVGKNKKKIQEYIKNQLQQDQIADQLSLKEFVDPFTSSKETKA